MKFNKETGRYEATKWIASLCQEIIGEGKTRELARQDLKVKLKAFRKNPDLVLVGTFNSPGYVRGQAKEGYITWTYQPERQAGIFCRRSLAEGEGGRHEFYRKLAEDAKTGQ